MFLGSTLKKIFAATETMAELLGVEDIHRDPHVRELETDDPIQSLFSLTIGEIHWEGEYELIFDHNGHLLEVYSVTTDWEHFYKTPVKRTSSWPA